MVIGTSGGNGCSFLWPLVSNGSHIGQSALTSGNGSRSSSHFFSLFISVWQAALLYISTFFACADIKLIWLFWINQFFFFFWCLLFVRWPTRTIPAFFVGVFNVGGLMDLEPAVCGLFVILKLKPKILSIFWMCKIVVLVNYNFVVFGGGKYFSPINAMFLSFKFPLCKFGIITLWQI